jgi:hypothetical protein
VTDQPSAPSSADGPLRAAPAPVRGLRLLRLRLAGVSKDYEIDFRTDGGQVRPLSVIAGPTNTGKTSVLRFLAYCLGGHSYPDTPEVVRQVRAALCEATTLDGWLTLERRLGSASVVVAPAPFDSGDHLSLRSRPVDPPGSPESLSHLLLSTVGLQDVQLREAPTQAASGKDPLSFRDVMWLALFPNERLGSNQLLFETEHMKKLKLQQVVDAVFGVHDDTAAQLGDQLKTARAHLDAARRDHERLEAFVIEQQPRLRAQLEADVRQAEADLRDLAGLLEALDTRESAAATFADDVRARYSDAAAAASRARARVRDRRSTVNRFASLRAQYADDIRKLTLLTEASTVFDQLSVKVCPACLNMLSTSPTGADGRCSLCRHELPPALQTDRLDLASAGAAHDAISTPRDESGSTISDADSQAPRDTTPSDDMPTAPADARADDSTTAINLVKAELRATRRRYAELDSYWQRLDGELTSLEDTASQAAAIESTAAAAVDRMASGVLTPYAAEREDLLRRREAALVLRDRASSGSRLWDGVDERAATVTALKRQVKNLQAQIKDLPARPGRDDVLAQISGRYASILTEIGFPKIQAEGELGPYIDNKLVPYVRGRSYREASSGGQVLISLAWILAVFETAYERDAAHPGILMIDTPQKNLGGQAAAGDDDFADITLIERFYTHVMRWLDGPGKGAQVIIVDNTPPPLADPHVVIRFTRNPDRPPFGLIDNETG